MSIPFGSTDTPGLLRELLARGVDFVVIGGIAAVLHGSPRVTQDLDVCFATDAGNLGALPVVPGIETIEIYADRGPAGEQNASGLAQRWLEAGREVFITVAPVDDWNPAIAS